MTHLYYCSDCKTPLFLAPPEADTYITCCPVCEETKGDVIDKIIADDGNQFSPNYRPLLLGAKLEDLERLLSESYEYIGDPSSHPWIYGRELE